MGNCCGSSSAPRDAAQEMQTREPMDQTRAKPSPKAAGNSSLTVFKSPSHTERRAPGPDKPKPMRRRSSITESFAVGNQYVIKLILDCLQRHRSMGVLKSLNSILMKFSKVKAGLSSARKAFQDLQDKETPESNTVSASELETACEMIGLEVSARVFSLLKLDPTEDLNFKEFVVALSLLYLLKPEAEGPFEDATKDPSEPPRQPTEFEKAIDIVVSSFNFFDGNADGFLEKHEVLQTFNTASSRSKRGGNISVKRFEEMDWDQDEKITFPEFLHAYETWIGFDDDEEEEEDFEGGSFRASTEGGSSIKKLLLTS